MMMMMMTRRNSTQINMSHQQQQQQHMTLTSSAHVVSNVHDRTIGDGDDDDDTDTDDVIMDVPYPLLSQPHVILRQRPSHYRLHFSSTVTVAVVRRRRRRLQLPFQLLLLLLLLLLQVIVILCMIDTTTTPSVSKASFVSAFVVQRPSSTTRSTTQTATRNHNNNHRRHRRDFVQQPPVPYTIPSTKPSTTTQLPLLRQPISSSSSSRSYRSTTVSSLSERQSRHWKRDPPIRIQMIHPIVFLSVPPSPLRVRSLLVLSATNNDDDDDGVNDRNNSTTNDNTNNSMNGDNKAEDEMSLSTSANYINKINMTTDISMIPNNIMDELTMKWESFIHNNNTTITDNAVLTWISKVWKTVAWHTITFTIGAIIGIVALVVPLHAQLAGSLSSSQPVMLFETILSDLEQAYVEPVDTNKLFETGVAAMLRSLDPYTEFEGIQAAVDMTESIEGRYGGVGLVISGAPTTTISSSSSSSSTLSRKPTAGDPSSTLLPDKKAVPSNDNDSDTIKNKNIINPSDEGSTISSPSVTMDDHTDTDQTDSAGIDQQTPEQLNPKQISDKKNNPVGIRVVAAFEGYAFDYGMRVGDKLLAIDNVPLTTVDGEPVGVDQVRNRLRGEPGTTVTIDFERDGVNGIQSITMPRAVVRIRDVKLATLLGNPEDGIGYIQLSGFASDAGREMRNAIQYLQRSAEDASHGERRLQGLVLDLRSNPGGLLTSAVDVASLLVPNGSDIVSAKGRGFPGIIYRSRVDPIVDTSTTKLAVLINGNTASAAEIVSGAVQDLDVGVIVGADRTFGKGLVQNVEQLPYNTALKFTVAKYYTPSGRCIQGVNYKEGDKNENDGKYIASKVEEQDRGTFYTRYGRIVRDGGGVEADYKVPSTKASALELVLSRSGLFSDFAAEWSKNHELTNNFDVDEDTYKNFQLYVNAKQKRGEVQLEVLYGKQLEDLKMALKASGYSGSEKSVEQLQARIVRDIQLDFNKYRNDLKEDLSLSILERYVPESMLIERGVKRDPQVAAAVELVSQRNTFDKLLAKGSIGERTGFGSHPPITSFNVAASATTASSQSTTPSTNDETRKEMGGIRSVINW